ncbi:MAG: thiamine pyrophosphate-binding protein [Clostridia bacterium]|nr:thiamine pyrophosphate-binding protein [Clostridia bacterium]
MKRTGGEVVVQKLIQEEVPYILGIPGHGVLGLFDAIRKADGEGKIRYLQVKHEQAATAMADGYYRVSGKPLAVFASIGPGTLNLSIGLATAFVDSTPFLALCGDTHTNMYGVGVLQEVERYHDSNIQRALEPLVKRCWRVETVDQLPRTMNNAFKEMLSGRRGPCAITLPMDVQADSTEKNIPLIKQPEWELPHADDNAVDKAIALMKTAKRPLIFVGGGALRTKAGELVEKLAEKWGAAIITTLAAKGTVKESHPQYCFHTGSKGTKIGLEISRSADVVLALGTRFADESTCSYRKGIAFNFPDTKLIQVDLDGHEIGKNYLADVGVLSDVSAFVTKVLEKDPDFKINKAYLDEIKDRRKAWFDFVEKKETAKTKEMTISRMIGVMRNTLPKNTVISTSSGNTQAQLFQEYCYEERYCNLTTGGFSTMGWAVPAAFGAKLALPDTPVVALVGDGDFMMIMQELSTAAQYNIPVITVLADNQGWMAIKDLQVDVLGKENTFGNDFQQDGKAFCPDFKAIAEGFHIKGYAANDDKSFKEALEDALKQKGPSLIHVTVSSEHPYSGGEAFGWWDVPIPGYMEEKRKAYENAIKEETV